MREDLFPIETLDNQEPPELKDEGALLLFLALQPLDPATAKIYLRKKYQHYLLTFLLIAGTPLLLFLLISQSERGVPMKWIQIGVWVVLAFFFLFFIYLIANIASRGKVYKYLGMRPLDHPDGETAPRGRPEFATNVAMLAERHGRVLEYGVGQKRNFWRFRGGSYQNFHVENRGGTFYASSSTPGAIRSVLSQLPPHRRWRNLNLSGGPEGLKTSRPVRLAKYFLYDLWLLEKMLAQK